MEDSADIGLPVIAIVEAHQEQRKIQHQDGIVVGAHCTKGREQYCKTGYNVAAMVEELPQRVVGACSSGLLTVNGV